MSTTVSENCIMCVDRGTSELKILLIDSKGKCRAKVRRPCTILSPAVDWLETDTEETYAHFIDAVRELLTVARPLNLEIVCISITSYMSGTIMLDNDGKVIGNAVLWNDSRTQSLANEWAENGLLEKSFELSGSQILTGWPLPLIAWWKQNRPDVLNKARYIFSMKDYLRYRLTGTIMTDVTEAALTPGNPYARNFSDDILKLFDVYEYKNALPPVKEPEDIAGYLLEDVAKLTGLKAGIPVVVGIGDMPSGILGTGVLNTGHGASSLGTTFLNGLVIDKPQPEPYNAGMTCSYFENRSLRLVNNSGGAAINYRWFIDNFYKEEQNRYGEKIYDFVDEEIARVPAGANGVMYHPYINACGVTAPFLSLGARAQFTGVGLHNTKADFLRAIYEGLGFAMYDCFSSVPTDIVDITVTGGGSRSPMLCSILADICGCPILLPDEVEATAIGTGICGAVGVGMYGSYSEAVENMVRISKEYKPNLENTEKYKEYFKLYRQIRNDMQPSWLLRSSILK